MLTPLPLLLMRNNGGRHYLTANSHSVLKKNRLAEEEMERESFPGCPAPNQIVLKYFMLFGVFLQVGRPDLRVCAVSILFRSEEQFAVNLSSTLCNTKAGIF